MGPKMTPRIKGKTGANKVAIIEGVLVKVFDSCLGQDLAIRLNQRMPQIVRFHPSSRNTALSRSKELVWLDHVQDSGWGDHDQYRKGQDEDGVQPEEI